ncbi:ImmA/IrrE family metallo-endopeptidase [Ectobacillus antri]|jgi:Zn-dependent peptidase ImmA (M78 family)|uniref:ImmA/IrrE family metallo-endopeptidase n=1 Tax=Ectobacillus antri TaxID=2486280 RepID=UPI000F59DB14|nr:ImmA/IrrE family metallo-endopeptidase [Ectobacillus antri]
MTLDSYTTLLEDWVSAFYIRIGIHTPDDLQIETIADRCNIIVLYEPVKSHCIANDFIRIIVVNSTLSMAEQREQFFHELCHILRHEGTQGDIPRPFRDLQEWDAVHFTKYAAIPSHMLQYIRLEGDVVQDMKERFKVTANLCSQRLQQIQNRLHSVYSA